jgi:hypothetical protein
MPFQVQGYSPSVPAGSYQAICTGVSEKAAKDDPSNVFLVWEFTLRDGTGRTVGATSNRQTTGKTKGAKWLTALLGKAPEIGELVEPVGKACTILVAVKDTTGYEFVEAVAAPEQAPAKSPVKPAVPAAPADEPEPSPDDALPF